MVNPNQHDAVSQLSTIRTSADDAAFVALGVIIRPGAEPRPFDYHAANRSMLPIHMLLRPRPTAAGGVTLSRILGTCAGSARLASTILYLFPGCVLREKET